jgi:para-nitrobenzyl esterase
MKKLVVAIAIIAIAVLLAVFRPWIPKVAADRRALRHLPAGDLVGFGDQHATFAWLGVPFARPPVGGLSWRAPQPLPRWRDERQTLALSPPCTQLKTLAIFNKHALTGSEDCLYLNIWTPRRKADEVPSKRLPVMMG